MVDFRIDVVVKPQGAVTGLKKVEKSLHRVQNRANGLRSSLGRMLGLLGGGMILRSAIRTLADFEQAIATVGAVTGATGKEFELLRERAEQLGITTRFTATAAAEALVSLSRSGFTAAESLDAVGDTLVMAQAGGLGLAEATTIAASALRGFRLTADEASRVADVLSKTANSSGTNMQQLGDAMKFVAPVAAGLGVSIEESAAAIGVLSNSGLKASLAGTGLRRVLAELESPTTKSEQIFARLGVSTNDVRVSSVGLTAALKTLRTAGMDTGMALEVFGDRGGPAFEILAAGSRKVVELTESLENSKGTAAETARVMDDNLNGAMLRLTSAFQGFILSVGGAGATGGLRGMVEGLAKSFRFLAANADMVIQFVKNLALFLGPRYLVGAIRMLTLAMAANPLGFFLVVVAGVAAAIPDLQAKITALTGSLVELGTSITGSMDFGGMLKSVAGVADDVIATVAGMGAAFGVLFDYIGHAPGPVGELMKKGFRDAGEAILDTFVALFQTLGDFLRFFGTTMVDVIGNSAISMRELLLGNLEGAQTAADNMTAALKGAADAVGNFGTGFSQNLKKLGDHDFLPVVELSDKAKQIGGEVAAEFQRGFEESPRSATEALETLLGTETDLAALGEKNGKVYAEQFMGASMSIMGSEGFDPFAPVDLDPKVAVIPQKLTGTAQELLDQLDATAQLQITEAALNEVLAARPDLAREIATAMRDAQIASLESSTAMSDGFERAFLKMAKEAEDFAGAAEASMNVFADAATDAISGFLQDGTFDFKQFALGVLQEIQKIIVRLLVMRAISGVTSMFGGGAATAGVGAVTAMAEGGTVQPDRSYMVGEEGPELFQPNQTGTIVPAAQAQTAPQVNVQVVNVNDPNEVPQAIDEGSADNAIINTLVRNRARVTQLIGR